MASIQFDPLQIVFVWSHYSCFPCSGELFAKCPVDDYPGIAVEGVLDSSRYFVLKIVDDSGMCVFFFTFYSAI